MQRSKNHSNTSTGVRWLLVNGKIAIADGKPADLHAGLPLRKPADTVTSAK